MTGVQTCALPISYRANEMFCTGTMGELAGVTTLDGRTIGDGTVGPMTQRLSELYREETATSGYALWEEEPRT